MQNILGMTNLCLLAALLAALGGLLVGHGLRGFRATRERESFESDWRGRLETSHRDLETRAARLREVETKFATLQTTSAATDAELSKLKVRIVALEPLTAQIAERDRKLLLLGSDLQSARDTHAVELAALRQKLTEADRYRAELDGAKLAARTSDDKLAAAQRRIAELEPLADQLADRDAKIRELEALRGEIAARDRKIADLEALRPQIAERDKRLAEFAPLRAQLSDRDAELVRLRAQLGEIDKLAGQVRDWNQKHDAVQKKFVDADSERDRLRKRVLELEPVAAQLPSRDAELGKFRARVTELEGSIGQLSQRDARIRELDAEITRLKARIAELDPLAGEARRLEQRVKTADDEMRTLRSRLGAIEPFEHEANTWRVRYGDLETKTHGGFRNRDAEIERLRRLLQELRSRPQETIEVVREVKLQPPSLAAQRIRRATVTAPKMRRPARKVTASRKPRQRPRDDLQLIYGVGPKLAQFLHRRGIHYFRQVARWSARDIARFEQDLPEFKGRIKREGWVKSARAEHIKKYGREP